MTEERVQATATVNASPETVFEVLADPTTHQAIDGTGWVRESLDGKPVTETGQIFRMAMYHENHPQGYYEMANRIDVFDPPRAIGWQPGQGPDEKGNMMNNSKLVFGGWIWRYDLKPVGDDRTEVTLTYDWSGVPPQLRDIAFPPFEPSHLDNSLHHLAELAEARQQ
ncbi:polyketide cyclase [Mycolicibacterium agri]|nr:SRPBCC family protein [Mycolicibacterium agri]PEG42842.1 polyketide cyclase [Mycolicibacterium agri]